MEKKEILAQIKKSSPFAEMLLSSDRNLVTTALAESSWEEAGDIDITIHFGSTKVSVVELNHIVSSLRERIEESIKTQLNYFDKKDTIEREANELVKDKLDTLQAIINDLRWKFEH